MKWPIVKLKQLASPEDGAIKIGPFGSQLKKSELTSDGIHVVGIENVLRNQFDGLGDRYVSDRKFQELRSVAVKPGDVLITMMGTIGEVAVVPEGTSTSIMDSHLLRFRPNLKVCIPEYIKLIIKGSAQTRAVLNARAHGAIMKGLNSSIIRELPAPLPPRSEQRRLVEILDQADALQKKRAEADAKAARVLPALFYKMFGDPATNPRRWPTDKLGKLFDVVGGGTPSKAVSEYWAGDIPWVSPKDMKCAVVQDTEDHITPAAIGNSATRLIKKGSVLVVYRSGILVHSFPIAIAGCDLTINQDLKALSSNGEVRNEYLYGLFSAVPSIGLACVKKGATVHNMDGARFLGLEIPIPPQTLQKSFAKQLETLFKHQTKIETARVQIEKLFDVLLHRAFTGDLTANWREAHLKELQVEMEVQTKMICKTNATQD